MNISLPLIHQGSSSSSLVNVHKIPSPTNHMYMSKAMDDSVSFKSSRSNFSSLYSGTSRPTHSRTMKLFNMRQEKELAKQKLMNGMKKEKREEYKNFFVQFDSFLFDKCELTDNLFSLSILYISALIHHEKCILSNTLQNNDFSSQEVEQSKAEVIEKLMELSFCYSQILQRHTFRREGIQTFRDTVSEQLFYECLYKIVNLIVQNQFDNPKLQSIIEAEIARLFRTQSFSLTKNDRKEIRLFIPSEKLYHLRQEMGFKPPAKKFVRRKVNNAVNSRSPLIMSVLPPYNKYSYSKDKGLDRGIENLRLHIPPDVLFNLNTKTDSANERESEASGVNLTIPVNHQKDKRVSPNPEENNHHHPTSSSPIKSFNYLQLD